MYLSEAIRKRIENLIKENKTNGNNLALKDFFDDKMFDDVEVND